MPNARLTDPETSHEAAKSVSRMSETYKLILTAFRIWGPMNDQRLIHVLKSHSQAKLSDSGIRSRRSELAATGLIVDTGDRVKMDSGRNSIVWGIA